MNLRPYQTQALQAALGFLASSNDPVLQLATGTGKSLIIAELANGVRERGKTVLILTHSQQLVKQNAATYERHTGQPAGIVCHGLGRADYNSSVTFATIQSIVTPALNGSIRDPGLIIIDEAHRVSHKTGEVGQYERIFSHYPAARRVAMTATPWRMDNGIIYGTGEQFWFDTLAYKYTVPQAVADGWLSPLVGVETEVQLDLENVTVGDEYVMKEVSDLETVKWLGGVAKSIGALAAKRKHIAVYCPTVEAAMRTASVIQKEIGCKSEVVTGAMKRDDRDSVMNNFLTGSTRVLCSVDTITTGFDFPALDCIVCLRPTVSSSLWVQIMGRGTRLAEGKKNCLLLDYVGNLQRLGGVDIIDTYVRERGLEVSEEVEAVPKEAPAKRRVLPGVRTLAAIDPMTGKEAIDGSEVWLKVSAVSAVAIPTRRNPSMPVLLVQYAGVTVEGARIDATQFISTESPTDGDVKFFQNRRIAVNLPSPAAKVIWQVRNATQPNSIRVRKAGKYWNVVQEQF